MMVVNEPNAFGLAENPDEDPFPESAEPETQAETPVDDAETPPAEGESVETPQAEEAVTEPALDEAPEATEGADTPPEPPQDTPEEEESTPERLFAGKFKSIEELEKGYQNVESLDSRLGARNKQLEEQNRQLQAYAEQALKQMEARRAQEVAEPDEALIQAAKEAGLDDEMLKVVQALADSTANKRVSTLQTTMNQERQQQQAREAQMRQEAVNADFFVRHPDVEPDGTLDNDVAAIVRQFDMDPSIPEALDVAYEAATDPVFKRVLVKAPHLLDNAEGLAIARDEANLNRNLLVAAQAQATTGNSKAREDAVRNAQVTTGGTGAPTGPGENTEKDDWQKALDLGDEPKSALGV